MKDETKTCDRRKFIKDTSVGVVGVAGTLVATAAVATAAATAGPTKPYAIPHVGPAVDPERPKGLGRRAMIDLRFPVAYNVSMPQAVSLVTEHFQALGERNLKGMADVMHFPFASFESVDAVLIKSPDDLIARPPASMNVNLKPQRYTDNDGYLKPGTYEIFESLEVLAVSVNNCVVSMSYTRYGSDGKKLHRCDGIYSVTNNNGRWAIQAMSTIFKPIMMVGVQFPNVIDAALRLRVDHCLASGGADADQEPPRQIGSRMNVSAGHYEAAPEGKEMEDKRVKGILSRITVVGADEARAAEIENYGKPLPPPSMGGVHFPPRPLAEELKPYADYRNMESGLLDENWGAVYGITPDARVIHHTDNKAHRVSGAIRFTASGEYINSSIDVDVITFRKRQWGESGSFCYTCPHDRTNDIDTPGPLYSPPGGEGRLERDVVLRAPGGFVSPGGVGKPGQVVWPGRT